MESGKINAVKTGPMPTGHPQSWIPTTYLVRVNGGMEWHPVYSMRFVHGGTPFVAVDGKTVFLDESELTSNYLED